MATAIPIHKGNEFPLMTNEKIQFMKNSEILVEITTRKLLLKTASKEGVSDCRQSHFNFHL